jgi:acyl transferase domain-containing protein
MSDLSERLARLSPEKRALLERRLRAEPPKARAAVEPVAIVGMACRLPGGVDTPERFWSLLAEGGDAVTEVPADRWDASALFSDDASVPGTVTSRWGGFLRDVDRFDAAFFGISPREASRMDPQQRLFLEVAWDALDDAGQDAGQLAGSRTGVFAGIHSHSADYFWFDLGQPSRMDAFTGPGTSHSILTGRLSYLFDLQGPSVAVDTACSSSLVAVHLACQSLRAGETTMALAGGVNLVLSPDFTIALSRLQMLSPDGRCRTFDARANGFVRSEGCAMVVLKRLSDALAHGDRIHAVIRGSALNQDGRTNGITAPNGLSQQRVIEQAMAAAGVDASEIGYVEAHGTGTSLGDPIEVEALAAALGAPGGASGPCYLGSAKANIGHAEGAAGVTGLIKAVLTLQHRAVPPLAHFTGLNPHISLDGTRFQIPTTLRQWESGGSRRLAGVSSFGWSGTNAHVIVEEAPEVAPDLPDAGTDRMWVLPLSARSEKALVALTERFEDLLRRSGDTPLLDLCHSAALRRTHHDYRVAATGRSAEELAQRLHAHRQGHTTWEVAAGRAVAGRRTSAVFVFSGQGPQWWAMGRELMATSAVFREQIERCSAALQPLAGWSIVEELDRDEPTSRLRRTDIAQPVLFALQIGLAAMWQSLGVTPAAVVGHSAGEIAAAHVAGMLSLEEAIRVAFHRGALMQRAADGGKMIAVELAARDVERALEPFGGRVSLAAVNAPQSCVISGDVEPVDELVEALQRKNVLCRPLRVAYAFHSAQMDGIAESLASALGPVRCGPARVPFVSSVTGQAAGEGALGPEYWRRNVRETVRFGPAIATLAARGHRLFVELSPHPVLASAIASMGQPADPLVALPSLVRGRGEQATVASTLAGLYAAGYPLDWRRVYPQGRIVALPRYPWQRERHWLPESSAAAGAAAVPGRGHADRVSLLGRRLRSPQLQGVVFESELSLASPPWLAEHRIHGAAMVPGAALLAMAVSAAETACGGRAFELRDFLLRTPLVVDDTPRLVQTQVTPRPGDQFDVEILSLEEPDRDQWVVHVTTRVSLTAGSGSTDLSPLEVARARCADTGPIATHYERLREAGASLGEPLQSLQQLRARPGESVGVLTLPRPLWAERTSYRVHPSLLDGSFQTILGALGADGPATLYVPQAIDVVRMGPGGHTSLSAHAVVRATPAPGAPVVADVSLRDDAGHSVAVLRGVVLGAAPAAIVRGVDPAHAPWLYEETWTAASDDALRRVDGQPRRWLIFVDRHGVGETLVGMLERAGHTCIRVTPGTSYEVLSPDHIRLDPLGAGQVERVCREVLAQPCAGVVYGWMLDVPLPADDGPPLDVMQERKCGAALALLQSIAALDPARRTALHVLTRGAQAVRDGETPNPAQATVWGLARVAALEQPDLRVVCVDLDPAAGLEDRHVLRATLAAGGGEREIAIRGGQRLLRRIRRLDTRAAAAAP